jgi:single-strand DNA-binding protein
MSYSNINRVVLLGRLTRDPELRTLPSGASVCDLRLACNGKRREADGSYSERPNYFDVNVYGSQGENVARYLSKGSAVAVDGRLEWREWETAEQQRRQAVRIVAESVQFVDRRGGEHGEGADVPVDDGGQHELAGEAQDREVELVF